MSDNFRRGAKAEFSRLLDYWRTIELWVKRAELINGAAVIPAINELRYASRQLYNGIRVFGKAKLSDGDKNVIRKRLIIAEQYLFNADHDVADAITGFFAGVADKIDDEFTEAEIVLFCPNYIRVKEVTAVCERLIQDARYDYGKRMQNYDTMRNEHFSFLESEFPRLKLATTQARRQRENLQLEVIRAAATIRIIDYIAMAGAFASIVAVPLALFFWVVAYTDFCDWKGRGPIIRAVCPAPDHITTPTPPPPPQLN